MSSGGEGEWPTVDELKKSVDMPNDDFDPQLDRILEAAIEQTKLEVGDWDEVVDEPDQALALYALQLAQRMAAAPSQAPRVIARDVDLERLMKGHRRRFGIA